MATDSDITALTDQAEQTLAGIRAQRDELREQDERLVIEEQALSAALEAMRARLPQPSASTRRAPARKAPRSRAKASSAPAANGSRSAKETGKLGGRRAAGDTRPNRRDEMLELLRSKPRTKRELQDALQVGPTRVRELIQELRDHDVDVVETVAPGPQRVKEFAVTG